MKFINKFVVYDVNFS